MKTLLLMRGAPGAGKSTWIREHKLEKYTLSPDIIRVMCSSTELQPDGTFKISQDRYNENVVWKILFDLLDHRMSRGEFTVIDATCSKTKDIKQYKEYAEKYKYRMYIVDFTDIPLDVCLKQNKLRAEEKWVPDEAIENIYARFATQQIPSGVKVIKRDEFDTLLETPIDLSEYKKVVFVGDIHGCYDTLMQYPDFKNGLNPEVEYIFCGDYVDRGNQNAEVLQWLDKIKDNSNVCLLEGNHERWIYDFGESIEAKSKEFEYKTKPELYRKGYTPKQARNLYRKIRQFSHFTYNGIEVMACHGGIPHLCENSNLLYLPTDAFIHGVGQYQDYIDVTESWMKYTKENQFLVHGHRNTNDDETQIADRVFNLEGGVEFGGQLRIAELEVIDGEANWKVVNLEDCQPITKELNTEQRKIESVEDAILYLRNNNFVNEKKLGNNISSFNFSRNAFLKRNWNDQTILARGLFIDTEAKTILARSYEKFFRIDETPDTYMSNLKSKLAFPVTAYLKENGFLAIVSYNQKTDDLFIASKSTNDGDYVGYIKKQLAPIYVNVRDYLRRHNNKTLVFECEDIKNDPHIIEYKENRLVLLDAIYNDLTFHKVSYEELLDTAACIGCNVKQKVFEINSWNDFANLYNEMQKEDYQLDGKYIEGFVFEDQNGFMTKCKTGYYNLWKKLRGVAQQTLKSGYIVKTGLLKTTVENLFYGFCRDLYKNDYDSESKSYPYPTDIISLRNKFENSK